MASCNIPGLDILSKRDCSAMYLSYDMVEDIDRMFYVGAPIYIPTGEKLSSLGISKWCRSDFVKC